MGKFALRVVRGDARGLEIPLEGEFVVGRGERGPGNLHGDPEISRRHARFYYTDDGSLLVEDLNSTNGTFVNEQRVHSLRLLRRDDRVRLGATTLEVAQTEDAAAATRVSERRVVSPEARVAPAAPAAAHEPSVPSGPRFAGSRGSRAGARTGALLALALIVAVGVAAYLIGHANSKATASTAASGLAPGVQGVVYIESNIAKPNSNSILAFQYRASGDLHPLRIAEYPTGGAGSADLTDSGVLDADHHLWLDTAKHLLFAVNQGSDTIAVFHVRPDGSLQAVAGSPFPSGGKAPASVSVSGNTAIVANKAQDGVRNLTSVSPSYATFHIGPDGALSQFGPVIKAPPGYSPTDTLVGPDGKFVMSTEEGGPFRAFELGPGGLKQGANSPLQPDPSIFPPGLPRSKRWGLGIAASPSQKLVYIGMATVNKIAVYRYNEQAKLTFVRAVAAPGAMLPCWLLLNRAGTRLYTANAGNDTVSVFDTSDPTRPKPLQTLHLHGDGNPWDMRFDPGQKMIFLIDPRARMNVPPGHGQGLHTLLINPNGTLTEPSYSPITVPVGLNVNPFGMAVYGRP